MTAGGGGGEEAGGPGAGAADEPREPGDGVVSGDFQTYRDRINIKYYRSTGPAVRAFLTGLKAGELCGGTCGACGHVEVPPRDGCPACGADVDAFEAVADEGEVLSWTRDADGNAFAVVRLDGTDAGFVHRLVGPAGDAGDAGDGGDAGGAEDLEGPHLGARVRAVFADPDDREGLVTDLKGFEVVEG